MDAITLTFGDCMENHVGMQKIGEASEKGYTFEDLKRFRKIFKKLGAEPTIYNLNKLLSEEQQSEVDQVAYILVIKNGINVLGNPNLSEELLAEHSALEYDKKYYDTRRSKVLNKLARWNLCFDDEAQIADFENKKGTIVAYDDVLFTKFLKNRIGEITEDDLKLEANYYYDITKTGIGYHGDTERKKVIGVRLGKDNVIAYKWFKNSEVVGNKFEYVLNSGDIYIMSEKAVGCDWKKKNIYTLRHAAGCEKYTK